MASNIVVTYNRPTSSTLCGQGDVGLRAQLRSNLIFWQKPYPLFVPATQPQAHPSGEQIFLNYGFGVLFSQGGSCPR